MGTDLSRREFLGTASAGVVAASMIGRSAFAAPAERFGPGVGFTRTRILRVYISSGRPSWPNPALDLEAEAKRIQAAFDKVPGLDDVEFVSNEHVTNPGRLARLLEEHQDVDGVLAVQLCLGTSALIGVLAEAGLPTFLFAVPYSGHEWCIVPDMQKQGRKLEVIPTSDFGNVAEAVRVLRTIHRLKETKLLLVTGGWQPPEQYVADVKSRLGMDIQLTDPQLIIDAYESIDPAAVQAEAERWTRNARKVVEPSEKDISDSSRMVLALKKLLADQGAYGITINCLGLFGQNRLPAYPCLGFAHLNDIGLAGICEADLASSVTQIIYQHMEGVPGFVTDPLFDLANDAVIHAHCVSATKMAGPDGPQCPYAIRSHLEDNKGASLQVTMHTGQEITMAKLVGGPLKERIYMAATPVESLGVSTMLISTGTITDSPEDERGCRTKIVTKVRDARKLLDNWTHGLHRVIFYGNHLVDTQRLARFLELNVVEEC